MFVNFFIDRPIFAAVLAIVLVVAGAVAIPFLPIAMFPEITPPQVVVTATYPGASAEVVEQSVTTPIEQQVNGVENMIYMSSRSGSDGTMTLTVTFKVGTDLDIAAVNVQNRVAIAQAKLPQDVIRQGLSITKQSPDLVEIVALISPDDTRDELYLSNYATLQVVDALARVPGVGQVTVFNGRDYGMRLWLNPDRLASLGLTAGDVADAVREQNLQAAAGAIGQPPAPRGQQFQYTVTTRGRLSTPAEFEDIILRTRADGSVLRLRDAGRVELGAQSYGSFGRVGGKPAALIGIFQLPGANALDVSRGVQAAVARLAPSFPSGVSHTRPYNTTEFVRVSIEEVLHTLLIAIGLVVLTVYVFLQDWRTTLIPTLTIPVSLVGTFAVISVFGFSINTLTLFGLVLAIGIVVDDAIVVVENTQRHRGGGPGHRHRARPDGGLHPDRLPARHHGPALPAVRADDRRVRRPLRRQRAHADARALRAAPAAGGRHAPALASPTVERRLRAVDGRLRPHRASHRAPRRAGRRRTAGAQRGQLPAAAGRADRLRADRGPGLPARQCAASRRRLARAHGRRGPAHRADSARDARRRDRGRDRRT
jgi:hydrophobe/amphiphile efflux-1 (HAE1) family protein